MPRRGTTSAASRAAPVRHDGDLIHRAIDAMPSHRPAEPSAIPTLGLLAIIGGSGLYDLPGLQDT
ncbi:MAG: hypothetical protein CFE26_16315, partial [Verrucomicrobiales bacterium VVV1]